MEHAQPQSPAEGALVGRTIAGKFRLEAMVGRGAMGCVYKATQLTLKKTVAIKVLNPSKSADGAYASRFKREAKAASRLDHPNSLRVIDFGEDDEGLLYIAMEFLQGRDLLTVLRQEYPLSRERIGAIFSQALAALAVAHEMGVIHRDLKPENIMLLPSKDDEGNAIEVVKVCDFGIAKIVEPEAEEPATGAPEPTKTSTQTGTLTAHGMLIGTPEYMSPEQARGEPADARSDIYSLGVILYQLLAGRLPFVANSKIRMVIKHVEERPAPPRDHDSKIDLGLEAICMKALEKRPEDRFQSAREMRAAFKSALEGDEGLVKRLAPSNPPPPARSSGATKAAKPEFASAPTPTPMSASQRLRRKDLDVAAASTVSTMDDPKEAAAAVLEARKRLSTGDTGKHERPPANLVAPMQAPAPAPTPAAPARTIVFAVAAVAIVAALAWLAMR